MHRLLYFHLILEESMQIFSNKNKKINVHTISEMSSLYRRDTLNIRCSEFIYTQ